jgi:hypothetical protein
MYDTMYPVPAINNVLTVAAISLHFLDLEAIYPNIRFSCEGATRCTALSSSLACCPRGAAERGYTELTRVSRVPGGNWYWACS